MCGCCTNHNGPLNARVCGKVCGKCGEKIFYVENYVENFFHGKPAKKADNWCYRRSFMLTCSGRGLWMTL